MAHFRFNVGELFLFYYLMLYHKITNKYCYQTFSAIIYHHPKLKQVASVASEVLERVKPSLWLFLAMKTKKILTLVTQMVRGLRFFPFKKLCFVF